MRRFFKKIHFWLAIPSGILIFILCITGAILSFQDEILEMYYPERYFVESANREKLALSELIPIVNKQLDDNSISAIKIPAEPNRTYIATLSKGFRISAFVDPYTGDVKGIYSFRESFFFKMMSLHRWLMDGSHTWGKYTMGIATLLFVVILLSGLVWWFPNKKKNIKNRFVVKTKYGIKRFFYDCHIALGMYAFIFLLVCSLTGLMWSFDWYRSGVYKIFGGDASKGKKERKDNHQSKPIDTSHWDDALNNIKRVAGDYEYINISNGEASVLTSSAPHLRATDKYVFYSNTGIIKKSNLYRDEPISKNLMTWAYALHVGSFGGIVMRILTCFACFIGATLPLTGYYIGWRKRTKKAKK